MNGPVLGFPALSRRAVTPALLFVLLIGGLTSVRGQSSSDVHVVPASDPISTTPPDTTSHGSEIVPADPTLSVQVDLVLVPVVVTDSTNRPVTGLAKNEFAIFENEAQQDIRYFSTEDAPISIGIILDLSGTMAKRIDAARQALRDFFRNSNLNDDYFVITFADRPQMLADSTSSTDNIEQSLSNVTPSGHTALLDAVHMGLQKLRSARYERRALLVISDGGDNWSRLKSREVIEEIEESDDYVYGIGVFSDEFPVLSALEVASGKHLLNRMCGSSGGRAIMINDLQNLSGAAATLGKEMRDQYVLGYSPHKTVETGERRKIKITVASSHPAAKKSTPLHLAYKKAYSAPRH